MTCARKRSTNICIYQKKAVPLHPIWKNLPALWRAAMVESVDTKDLKSFGQWWLCGFKSHSRYSKTKSKTFLVLLFDFFYKFLRIWIFCCIFAAFLMGMIFWGFLWEKSFFDIYDHPSSVILLIPITSNYLNSKKCNGLLLSAFSSVCGQTIFFWHIFCSFIYWKKTVPLHRIS